MAHSNEDAVQQKMEEMKRKNEELRQRHAEIEMDKKNAEEYSRAVIAKKMSNPVEKKVTTRIPATRSPRQKLPPDIPPQDIVEKRSHRISEGTDGPPSDPKYSFLSDPSRKRTHSDWNEGQKDANGVQDRTSRGLSRRHPNNYGGADFENVKSTMDKQRTYARQRSSGVSAHNSDLTLTMTGRERIQYDAWKKERELVDQDRIERQKTGKGTWSREWDSHKYPSEQDPDVIPRMPQFRGPSDKFSETIPFHEPLSPDNQSTTDLQVKGILKASSIKKANEETFSNSPMTRDHSRTSKSPRRIPARVRTTLRPKLLATASNSEIKNLPWTCLVKPNVANLPGFGDVPIKSLYPGWKPGTSRDAANSETLSKDAQVLLKDSVPSHPEDEDVSLLMENLKLNHAANSIGNLPDVTVVLSAHGKVCKLDNQKKVHLNTYEGEIYESENRSDSETLNRSTESNDSNIYKYDDDEGEWEDCSGDEEDMLPVAAEFSFNNHNQDSGIVTDVSAMSSLGNIFTSSSPQEQR